MLCAKLKSASKSIWIEESDSALCKANRSLISALTKANKVSDCETTSALHRAQLCFSREAKGKAAVTSLPTAKASIREAKSEAHFGANSKATSLKEILHSTKAPSAEVASPHGEAILTSLPAKRKASKVKSRFKPKATQPIRANIQPPRVSVLDHLGPVNTDLREFLSNKQMSRRLELDSGDTFVKPFHWSSISQAYIVFYMLKTSQG